MNKLAPLVSLALLFTTAALPAAPARADMVVEAPVALTISGSVDAGRLAYRITNPTDRSVELGQPRLVVLERGVRIPVRITSMTVDGRATGLFDRFELRPGQTITVVLTPEALRHGELELRFIGARVEHYVMTV